jgi:hypothetical protein
MWCLMLLPWRYASLVGLGDSRMYPSSDSPHDAGPEQHGTYGRLRQSRRTASDGFAVSSHRRLLMKAAGNGQGSGIIPARARGGELGTLSAMRGAAPAQVAHKKGAGRLYGADSTSNSPSVAMTASYRPRGSRSLIIGPSLASVVIGIVYLKPWPPWRGRMTMTAASPAGAFSSAIINVLWPTEA